MKLERKVVPIAQRKVGIVTKERVPHVGPLTPRLSADTGTTYAVGFTADICASDEE